MKAQINHKRCDIVKGNVTYVSSFKKRNNVKPYIKFDLDWQDIIRANDPEKPLHEAAVNLASKIAYELHKNHDRTVYLSTHWIQGVTKKKARQSSRIRGQIEHIFNMIWQPKVFDNGVWLYNVFEVSYREGYEEILGLQDVTKKACTQKSIKSAPTVKNVQGGSQKCLDYIDNKEKEEEALAYSSSFSNNEKLKIKSFSEPEPIPQEISTEIPTLATSSLTELAKVYQTEEIRSEASEVVTICHGLEAQLYEKSVQLETQALAAEKEHYQSHKHRESSSGISLLQDVPLLTNLLIEPNTETTEIQEEITEMKAQQILLEPERNMEFELSGAIFKNFGNVRSGEIMENCKFIPITPSKLGVQVSNGFSLSANDKETLKACIRQVYGNNINIVSSAVVKITQPETKFLQEPQNEPKIQKWEKFKKELLSFFPEKTGDHILNAWFDKLRVSEDVSNNRIILTGSTFYVDSVYNRFQTAIESVVKKMAASQNKVTLELHYENNSQRPIIYKPNGGF